MPGVRREGVIETTASLQRAGLIHYNRGSSAAFNCIGFGDRWCSDWLDRSRPDSKQQC
jgi:hypothetical protein